MAKFDVLSHSAAVEAAIDAAGHLLAEDVALVTELRRLAIILDDPAFPIVDGRFDNVTPALFKQVCAELMLTPASRAVGKRSAGEVEGDGGGQAGKLASFQARAKLRKVK